MLQLSKLRTTCSESLREEKTCSKDGATNKQKNTLLYGNGDGDRDTIEKSLCIRTRQSPETNLESHTSSGVASTKHAI